MHEYSIIQALMGRVEAEAASRGATAIHRVEVRIGELSGVEADLLATAFDTWREGTICANARLEIERVPALWSCPRCEATILPTQALRCAACARPARLTRGDEIFLDRIEMEVP